VIYVFFLYQQRATTKSTTYQCSFYLHGAARMGSIKTHLRLRQECGPLQKSHHPKFFFSKAPVVHGFNRQTRQIQYRSVRWRINPEQGQVAFHIDRGNAGPVTGLGRVVQIVQQSHADCGQERGAQIVLIFHHHMQRGQNQASGMDEDAAALAVATIRRLRLFAAHQLHNRQCAPFQCGQRLPGNGSLACDGPGRGEVEYERTPPGRATKGTLRVGVWVAVGVGLRAKGCASGSS